MDEEMKDISQVIATVYDAVDDRISELEEKLEGFSQEVREILEELRNK